MISHLNKFWIFCCIGLFMPLIAVATTLEVRYAGFYPTSHIFRNLYGNTCSWQLEASQPFYSSLSVWSNVDYLSQKGQEKECSTHTHIKILNVSLGIKYLVNYQNSLTYYMGAGPALAKIQVKNKGRCFDHDQTKLAVGAFIKAGVNYYFYKNLFLDIFIDYFYLQVYFKKHANVGGFKPGVGVGIAF